MINLLPVSLSTIKYIWRLFGSVAFKNFFSSILNISRSSTLISLHSAYLVFLIIFMASSVSILSGIALNTRCVYLITNFLIWSLKSFFIFSSSVSTILSAVSISSGCKPEFFIASTKSVIVLFLCSFTYFKRVGLPLLSSFSFNISLNTLYLISSPGINSVESLIREPFNILNTAFFAPLFQVPPVISLKKSTNLPLAILLLLYCFIILYRSLVSPEIILAPRKSLSKAFASPSRVEFARSVNDCFFPFLGSAASPWHDIFTFLAIIYDCLELDPLVNFIVVLLPFDNPSNIISNPVDLNPSSSKSVPPSDSPNNTNKSGFAMFPEKSYSSPFTINFFSILDNEWFILVKSDLLFIKTIFVPVSNSSCCSLLMLFHKSI